MGTELFIITGTSGTGKSTIAPILQKELPEDYRVYDWDAIVRPYDGTGDSWANEVVERMFQITRKNIDGDTITVVLGLIKPSWIKEYQSKYGIENIKFCLLNISEKERAKRLRERNAPEYLIHDLEELQGLPFWLEESGFENGVIDTSELDIPEVVKKIKSWIRS